MKKNERDRQEEVEMSRLFFNEENYLRRRLDPDRVQHLLELLEAGIEFKTPIVVQTGTYEILDGNHRIEAYAKHGVSKITVKVVDLPDTEKRTMSIKLNRGGSTPLTVEERRFAAIRLMFVDRKSPKEIGQTLQRSLAWVSNVLSDYEYGGRNFSDFTSKNPKIDRRKKTDTETDALIEAGIIADRPTSAIAKEAGVSNGLISQRKAKFRPWHNPLVYLKLEYTRLNKFLGVAFINRYFDKARFEFKADGVLIRNRGKNWVPSVVAWFPAKFFDEYRIQQPIDIYAELDIMNWKGKEKKSNIDTIEIGIDNGIWSFRLSGYRVEKKTYKSYGPFDLNWTDMEPFYGNSVIDANGLPQGVDTACNVIGKDLPIHEKGKIEFRYQDGELSTFFKCGKYENECHQMIPIVIMDKDANTIANIEAEQLKTALNCFQGQVWLGMWQDHERLAIGKAELDWRACFVI